MVCKRRVSTVLFNVCTTKARVMFLIHCIVGYWLLVIGYWLLIIDYCSLNLPNSSFSLSSQCHVGNSNRNSYEHVSTTCIWLAKKRNLFPFDWVGNFSYSLQFATKTKTSISYVSNLLFVPMQLTQHHHLSYHHHTHIHIIHIIIPFSCNKMVNGYC
jgi:hypothetical protein